VGLGDFFGVRDRVMAADYTHFQWARQTTL